MRTTASETDALVQEILRAAQEASGRTLEGRLWVGRQMVSARHNGICVVAVKIARDRLERAAERVGAILTDVLPDEDLVGILEAAAS